MPVFDTPEPITAIIDNTFGHVRIEASDRADTVVDVRPRDPSHDPDVRAAEQAQIVYDHGRLLVRLTTSKIRSLFSRPPAVEVRIELPSGSSVEAKGAADFHGTGRLGEATFDTSAGAIRLDRTGRLRLRTGAGDVSIGRTEGHTAITSSTGRIRVGEIDGTAVIKTSNGDITIGEASGDLRLNTANGDITIDRAQAAVSAKTAFGGIRIGEVVRGSVVLESGFGELELGVREGTAAWLDVASNNGRVHSELTAADEPEKSEETVEVRARTAFGDIAVRRS